MLQYLEYIQPRRRPYNEDYRRFTDDEKVFMNMFDSFEELNQLALIYKDQRYTITSRESTIDISNSIAAYNTIVHPCSKCGSHIMTTVLKLLPFEVPKEYVDEKDIVSISIQCIICQHGKNQDSILKISNLNQEAFEFIENVWNTDNPEEECTEELNNGEIDVFHGVSGIN